MITEGQPFTLYMSETALIGVLPLAPGSPEPSSYQVADTDVPDGRSVDERLLGFMDDPRERAFADALDFLGLCATDEEFGPSFQEGFTAIMSGRATARQIGVCFALIAVLRGQDPEGRTARLFGGPDRGEIKKQRQAPRRRNKGSGFIETLNFVTQCAGEVQHGSLFRHGLAAVMSGRATAQQIAGFLSAIAANRGESRDGPLAKLIPRRRQ
jgi:hypothetical protein